MTEQPSGEQQDPAGSENPPEGQQGSGSNRLEDLLASLDDEAKQAVLGEVSKARSEAAKYRKDAKGNAAAAQRLAELEKQNMSADERFAEAQIRAVEAELMLTRYQVAADKGLNASDAQFLYGDSEEEIAAAADALLARLGTAAPQRPAAPDLKQGARGGTPRPDPNDAFRQAIRSRQMFS